MSDSPIKGLLSKMRNSMPGAPADAPPPAVRRAAPPPGPRAQQQPREQSKNAAMVYAGGAGVLYILSFYNLAQAAWFNGLILLLPATSLAYLAYRYLVQAEE